MSEEIALTDIFPAFPKVPRRRRPITITEKIDGTNGLISITQVAETIEVGVGAGDWVFTPDGTPYRVRAGSRSQWLKPNKQQDNHGFCQWVYTNKETIVQDLGVGNHYGEWWGNGIQRGYGLGQGDKRFSLFNTHRWSEAVFGTPGVGAVPIIYDEVDNDDRYIGQSLFMLEFAGSLASPGFMKPEGVVIYEQASHRLSKVTIEGDAEWKGKDK